MGAREQRGTRLDLEARTMSKLREWISPNGVSHLVNEWGRCITCGRNHERPPHSGKGD